MSEIQIERQELEDSLSEMRDSLFEYGGMALMVYVTDTLDAVCVGDYERAERHLNGLYLMQSPYTQGILECLHRVKRLMGDWK